MLPVAWGFPPCYAMTMVARPGLSIISVTGEIRGMIRLQHLVVRHVTDLW